MTPTLERAVEAVAYAYETRHGALRSPGIDRRHYKSLVLAVLRAIREADEGMADAANGVKVFGADLHDFVADSCAAPVWRAMIDHLIGQAG